MKHLLLTTIAAVVLVGCGEAQQSAPAPESKPEPPTAKAPDISIHDAVEKGNIEAVKQHLAAGTDVDAKAGSRLYGTLRNPGESTALHTATGMGHKEIAELLIAEEPIYRKPFALYENCNCIATRDNCCQTISKGSIARKNIDASH